MGEKSKIEWCDHTFNPWWGCAKVSPGCANCYAKSFSEDLGFQLWGIGPGSRRKFFGDKHWDEPVAWNRKADPGLFGLDGAERPRVFTGSMCDIFEDHNELEPHQDRLFRLIDNTPNLDWLMLTKNPENVEGIVPERWKDGRWPRHAWLGVSAENQEYLNLRGAILLSLKQKHDIPFAWFSLEPLLGEIDIGPFLTRDKLFGQRNPKFKDPLPGAGWVVIGGESGPLKEIRPCNIQNIRNVVVQCKAAKVPVFVKQLGALPGFVLEDEERQGNVMPSYHHFRDGLYIKGMNDRKGGDWSEWPEGLRVREFPNGK